MYRILVPIDKNEDRTAEQIKYVKSLPIDTQELEVVVLHVDEADYDGSPPRDFEDIPSATMAEEEISEAGIVCQGVKGEGQVAKTIIETAESFGADQIVLAGRKRSGVSEVVLGSITRDITRAAECPVVVVG